MPTTIRADVPVSFRVTEYFKDTMLPVKYRSWLGSFQGYLKPGICYVSAAQLELTNVAFRATKILSTVEVDIPVAVAFGATKILSTLRADIPVDHQILFAKLNHYGIRRVSNNLRKSYLSNCDQYQLINGIWNWSCHYMLWCPSEICSRTPSILIIYK